MAGILTADENSGSLNVKDHTVRKETLMKSREQCVNSQLQSPTCEEMFWERRRQIVNFLYGI